jgi:hypothetical protein
MSKILKTLGIIALTISIIIVCITAFLFIKSRIWESEFQSNINSEYLVSESVDIESALDEKIKKYIISEEDTNFITFTPKEVGEIVRGSLIDILGTNSLEVGSIYIEPANTTWNICGFISFVKMKSINGWVCADITKDNMQTAQLYVESLKVQGINITKFYPKLLNMINKGIAQALVTANENGFVGRVFENIEFQAEQLVIKGSLY